MMEMTEQEFHDEIDEVEGLVGGSQNKNKMRKMKRVIHKASSASASTPNKRSNRLPVLSCLCLITLIIAGGFAGMTFVWDKAEKAMELEDPEHAPLVARQIENFRNGSGIVLNVHITHHAGTTLCSEFGEKLTHPGFACTHVQDDDNVTVDNYPSQQPWGYDETATNIEIVRPFFKYISWEFKFPPAINATPQIKDTNWEDPNLISILVMREPISRALAGDGKMLQTHNSIFAWDNGTLEEWWAFAHEELHNNNYALRILSDATCCNGAQTDRHYLEAAKELVRRFTFVIDIDCVQESLEKIADLLGFELRHYWNSANEQHQHKPLNERVPFPEVLDYLLEKNTLDIELYEWSKSLSLVKCDAFEDDDEDNDDNAP